MLRMQRGPTNVARVRASTRGFLTST